MTDTSSDVPSIEKEELIIVPPFEYNRYGWIKDKEDDRDLQFTPSKEITIQRDFSLRDKMPPVLNQGKLGSCTANGICNAIRFCEIAEDIDGHKPRSRLFVYYNERAMEGNVNEDSGAQIRDGIKSINKQGACFEETWPYDITQFTEKPTPNCYKEAKKHRTLKYERVSHSIDDIKAAIQSGFPVVFGFVVYDSIEKPTVARSGIIPMPSGSDEQIGGHCIICCGWDDTRRLFEIQNSWGTEWGNEGYGYMSYDYLADPELASDFWKITFVQLSLIHI